LALSWNHIGRLRQKLNRSCKIVPVVVNSAAELRRDVRIVIVLCQRQKRLHLLKHTLKVQRKVGVGNKIGLVCIASSLKTNL